MSKKKFFLSKYCLTDGIKEVVVSQAIGDGKFVKAEGYYVFFDIGKDMFESRADAVADANKRRIKKIASLKKQVAKLEALKFS